VSDRAEECRRLARDCLALAADPRTAEDVRQAFLDAARDWTRRANVHEAALSPAVAPQPVMQQQQQQQTRRKKDDE
jgi:hypothetical protein